MSKLFISYSHVDSHVLERLHTHMAILKEEGKVSTWFDREILAGGDLDSNIKEELTSADIFIAIVSPDYLNSKYLNIPTKVRHCSALKYPIYSGAKYTSQIGLYHH